MTQSQQPLHASMTDLPEGSSRAPSGNSFSFIVRVWKEANPTGDSSSGWRGSIERVGLNKRIYIHQLESILAYIEEQTGIHAEHQPMRVLTRVLRQFWHSLLKRSG